MTNEELTKIAWTRELTDGRVATAAAYWLDCSPHERTEADGIILARYARLAMQKIDLAVKALKEIANADDSDLIEKPHAMTMIAISALEDIRSLSGGNKA